MTDLPAGFSVRPYDPQKDFDTVYDLVYRDVGDAVRAQNHDKWPEPDQTTFFKQIFEEQPPQLIVADDGTGDIAGSFCTLEEEGVTVLDEVHFDWEFFGKDICHDLAKAVVAEGLAIAHQRQTPFEIVPLSTDYRFIKLLQANGFENLVTSPVGYDEGSKLKEDFDWVQTVILRHKDTAHYAPSAAPVVSPGPLGYTGA